MARIFDPQLSIHVGSDAQAATIVVTCDLEFTASEVRRMTTGGGE
jgi:hypothetical protein